MGEAKDSASNSVTTMCTPKNGLRIRFKIPTEEQARDTTDSIAQCLPMRNIKIQHAKSENNYDEEEVTSSGNASSKRKRRACDDIETPTCEVCGKTFPSLKAKYGHMRCHSNRPPRRTSGISTYLPSPDPVTGERGLNETEIDDDILAAMTLVFMSRDYSPPTGLPQKDKKAFFQDFLQFEAKMEDTYELEDQHQNIDELDFIVDGNTKIRKNSNGQTSSGGRYQCRTCKKCFSSHQALGGHTANHNKNKRELDEVMVIEESSGGGQINAKEWVDTSGAVSKMGAVKHTCEICNLTFPSGQALGGHKRRHWMGPKFVRMPPSSGPSSSPSPSAASPSTSAGEANHGLGDLDLNKTPASEEQDW